MKELALFIAGIHYLFGIVHFLGFFEHYERALCHLLAAIAWLLLRLVLDREAPNPGREGA